jgi:hypothetical protein
MRKLDLAGQTFGNWTVLATAEHLSDKGRTYWACKCICGEERVVAGTSLTNGSSMSCGCAGGQRKSSIDATDYIDRRFGRLVVMSIADPIEGEDGKKRTAYLCHCDCGNELIIKRHAIQGIKGPKSCGCLLAEQRSALGLSKRLYEPHIATARMIFGQRYADNDLEFEDFIELSQQPCHYCGSLPNTSYNKYAHRAIAKVSEFALENGTFTYNGLDRIDSNQPHSKDNCVPCCIDCNTAKSDWSVQEFKDLILRIYNHWAKNPIP